MNKNVRRIATQTLSKVTAGKKIDMTNLEATIDAYVLAVISATVTECSDIIRTKARDQDDDRVAAMLKAASVDIQDHFEV
jgi:hypothetical protein